MIHFLFTTNDVSAFMQKSLSSHFHNGFFIFFADGTLISRKHHSISDEYIPINHTLSDCKGVMFLLLPPVNLFYYSYHCYQWCCLYSHIAIITTSTGNGNIGNKARIHTDRVCGCCFYCCFCYYFQYYTYVIYVEVIFIN